MKVKELLLLAGLMAFAGNSSAVNEFEVTAPAWKQLVVSTSDDGVNIRKLPSTTAPKLVYNENAIDNFDIPASYYGYWSTKPTGGAIMAVKFSGPDILVGEKDGWYEVKNIGPKCSSNGWVSGKFCKAVTPSPISSESARFKDYLKWITNGTNQYNGAYGLYLSTDEMEGTATFYLGRLIDGKLVCPYSFGADYSFGTEYSQYQLKYDSSINGYQLICPTFDPSLADINTEILSTVMANMGKLEDGNVLVVCDIDGYLATFPY